MHAPPSTPSLADQLRGVVVSPRHEMHISRHRFRSGPAYVLRDPVTFKTHRLDPEDYQILSMLDRSTTLGETFRSLVELGVLAPEDEARFYEFIVGLHQKNLLTLPLSDGAVLYERFERRRRAENISRALGVFFMRVPLINPDHFLTRTLPLARWLFTKPAFAAWIALAFASAFIVIGRWSDLTAPVATMFTGGNILLLWGTLIGLKVVHEFGHAYACKAFGGHVPEMGAFFVIFTPLAYVDATDSWSFTRTRHRAIVTLAGVYVESIVGALALMVWATTGPSVLNTLAYQTVLLATVTTALFNLNPLLRYDAYYLAADLSGVPNLRARCEAAVASYAKRVFFGVRDEIQDRPTRHTAGLLAFGLAQLGYRVIIMMTIATVLIMKFGGAGIAMAALILGLTVGKAVFGLVRYMRQSEEIADRRLRSTLTAAGVAATVLAGVLFIPLPMPIDAKGISSFERVETIHAPNEGVVRALPERVGNRVPADQVLMVLDNEALIASRQATLASVHAGQAETVRAVLHSPAEARSTQASERAARASLAKIEADTDLLRIRAPERLHVLALHKKRPGTPVRRGDPLISVGFGRHEAVFLLGVEGADRMLLAVGDRLEFRSPSEPGSRFAGTVVGIGGAVSRVLDARLSAMAQSLSIPIDHATGHAIEPYFEIRLALDPDSSPPPPNATLVARVPARSMTAATVIHRRFSRFMNEVKRGYSER